MKFEERLQQALEEAGISQSELARRVGVNSQSVSGWCSAGILPRKEKLELLPKALGKPLYWFFMDHGEEESIKAATGSKVVLTERQAKILAVFDQLPGVEQDRFIDMATTRLNELDQIMAEYFRKRKIDPPANK
ncbi:helix-turn-helix domain-containing protein [Dickeya solani]|uniref:Helix-turn-helix domain-containing protein n=1 Tax=Dickeya solani TaxID=1089444 RepID=A0ABU4ELB4_9GAMM|nr:helix-turn-helix domain-containing protein [Dickeya solani]MCA6998181.1 helix-turn-helix domain-containing protein [Dickeya solani]MDV6997665.1 helix-turn-helix domain-containing protein [Dickeya solani]MDV7006475.1 helix-turn-helix domain-containing protein [Dickeya solani]MDV7040466.1 helix-turn-helix domain-containing protein [Dickeya solani]MDV7044860.1 helix-turn-helix domain-containing protein [Dickeya solani]